MSFLTNFVSCGHNVKKMCIWKFGGGKLDFLDPSQETESKVVWPRLKIFWFSKDGPTGHSKRKKKQRWERQYLRVDRNELCQLN